VPRIDTWLREYLGADMPEPYLSEISRKWLLAAVARIFEPGIKFDHMLVLEGIQGRGKSTVGRMLATTKKWFRDELPDLKDKDAAGALLGSWIIEMGELATLSRSELRVAKAFIVREIDKVRPPYGKRFVERERQCVFFGTTNDDTYLVDPTGNRRFWPCQVDQAKFKALEGDVDQLWAEALFVWGTFGENLWLEGEAKEQAEMIQGSRLVEDVGQLIDHDIAEWLRKLTELNAASDSPVDSFRFRIGDLFDGFSNIENISHLGGGVPLEKMKTDNFNLQKAGFSLRKNNCRAAFIKGKRFYYYDFLKGSPPPSHHTPHQDNDLGY